jgi:hypothetical protein
MYPKKERVLFLLDAALKEMNLLLEMSKDINAPHSSRAFRMVSGL